MALRQVYPGTVFDEGLGRKRTPRSTAFWELQPPKSNRELSVLKTSLHVKSSFHDVTNSLIGDEHQGLNDMNTDNP